MSAFEADIRAYLVSVQSLYALVGDRIRPLRTNQLPVSGESSALTGVGDSLPRITYQRISNPRPAALTGATSLSNPRIQMDCVAATYAEAKAISDELRNCLHGYRGQMGQTFIDSCLLDDERDFEEPVPGLDDASTFGVSIDFLLFIQEAQPTGVLSLE